ncbi:uncharacterized protein DUF397 [Streptomyces sp. 3211.6]|uniref:DUF397 domain-containing protein n=1 Tax=Streptomyces TaxID=1883 RepID=UPI0009A47354|nr:MULTISPECIES: DUF397 domain-containing protein [Streptomyces]RKT06454.1 uncharacterized protein DUF397 [Streptomyces sp. 3211.6]RPF46012.1 uncharacterized protein DUF397 [Streptomyces sp. Ag109_G2-6]
MTNSPDAPRWFTSSHSSNGGDCVEVATNLPGTVPVRDSKAGDGGPVLTFSAPAFAAFLGAVRTP